MHYPKPNLTPLKWVASVAGEARQLRAGIVLWRNSVSLLWDLMARHSSITLQVDTALPTEPMRILTSTGLVMSEIVSLHARLEDWCAWLHSTGLDCSSLDAVLEAQKCALMRVMEWEKVIRVVGGALDPDAVLASYSAIEQVTYADLNAVASALTEAGRAAEAVAMKGAGCG